MRIRFNRPFPLIPGDLAVVLTAFVVSRLLARSAGVRLDVGILQWAWQLLDLDLLRHDLARSLVYLHAQPPLGNLIVGLALAAEPVPLTVSLGLLGHALGIATACALLVTFRRLGMSPALRVGLVTAYTVSPSAILYEHFVAYEYMLAACLAGALALLLGFATTGRWRDLAGGFGLLGTVALTRSLFHFAWLVGVTVLVLLAVPTRARRVLPVAVITLLLTTGWYAKNLMLFGSFSGSTWLGMNLARMTTFALPSADREARIAEGKLSPLARVAPFSPLEVYTHLGVALPRPHGVPAVDAPRKANGNPNFNHAAYMAIARIYARDAIWVIRKQTHVYLQQVRTALAIHVLPASDYIFLDANRAHIARYRALFDGVGGGGMLLGRLPHGQVDPWPPSLIDAFRRAPALPLGFVVLFTVGVVMAATAACDPASRLTRLALVLACWNVLWVAIVGSLFEVGENNRFRVAVNPHWLVLAGVALHQLTTRVRRARCGLRKSQDRAEPDGSEDRHRR